MGTRCGGKFLDLCSQCPPRCRRPNFKNELRDLEDFGVGPQHAIPFRKWETKCGRDVEENLGVINEK